MTIHDTRAERIALILEACDAQSPAEVLIDLLTDARHWCHQQGEDFARLNRLAEEHFAAELRGE